MNYLEKQNKIDGLMGANQLDALILGDSYNIQYATGVRIPASLAQPDLAMFALFFNGARDPLILVPQCWHNVARQECYYDNVVAYRPDINPLEAAVEALASWCGSCKRVGVDSAEIPVTYNQALARLLDPLGIERVSASDLMAGARSQKTASEVDLLSKIAYKTDHVINGHFHHLIADRLKAATQISESLRVHSSERDIEIAGYNACARGTVGDGLGKFWAYAPKYGFADSEMTGERDLIIADALTSDGGYWSNSTRIAINHDDMSTEQEAVYNELNLLRNKLLESLQVGRKCSEVYAELVDYAGSEGLNMVANLCLGFCVGVSAMEGPFLSPGEERTVESSMVFVLDPVVKNGARFYRSRDTVVITAEGARIVNWYKDWREPYIAILEL